MSHSSFINLTITTCAVYIITLLMLTSALVNKGWKLYPMVTKYTKLCIHSVRKAIGGVANNTLQQLVKTNPWNKSIRRVVWSLGMYSPTLQSVQVEGYGYPTITTVTNQWFEEFKVVHWCTIWYEVALSSLTWYSTTASHDTVHRITWYSTTTSHDTVPQHHMIQYTASHDTVPQHHSMK